VVTLPLYHAGDADVRCHERTIMPNPPIEKPTSLEKVSGSRLTEIAATLLGAASGSPMGALLPVLTNALASGRDRCRVETAIENLSLRLERQESKVRDISDSQYKLINEAVLAMLSTVEAEKHEYLQSVALNALDVADVEPQEATVLSRLVRDLSANEVTFLLANSEVRRVWFNTRKPGEEGALHVVPDSSDGLVVSGLISLGLLIQAGYCQLFCVNFS
jgi:hypothetical protein